MELSSFADIRAQQISFQALEALSFAANAAKDSQAVADAAQRTADLAEQVAQSAWNRKDAAQRTANLAVAEATRAQRLGMADAELDRQSELSRRPAPSPRTAKRVRHEGNQDGP